MNDDWATRARRVIAVVRADAREAGLDAKRTLAAIDAAYPFGPRKHWPYKAWLAERRKVVAELAGDPLSRPCPACGAGAGRDCRPIGAPDRRAEHPHAARAQLDHGPLFSTASPEVTRG